jgi:hypothetical protein
MRTKESETKENKVEVNQNLLHKWLIEVQQTKVLKKIIEFFF